MIVRIIPKRLSGKVDAVSSKSDAHRKIIASGLADKPTYVKINNFSDDIFATLGCIKELGGGYERHNDGVMITPILKGVTNAKLDFRESGSTARFLLPVAAALCGKTHAFGCGRLPERPFFDLTNQLRLHGVEADSDTLPINMSGQLKSGDYSISGSISSQYLTGLLFALPLLGDESRITLTTPLLSAPYVDMTIDTLKEFSVEVGIEDSVYTIKPQKYISHGEITAEGDWSAAAFWIVAQKICKDIDVLGMNYSSRQGDMRILDILEQRDIDASQIPDLVPILTVLAASRTGRTVIRRAERLRHKESNRLLAMCECINNLGGYAKETEDGMIIEGTGRLKGGRVDGFSDHRVVMSAAIASLICENPVEITDAESVKKSYPKFFEDFIKLGGEVIVLDR